MSGSPHDHVALASTRVGWDGSGSRNLPPDGAWRASVACIGASLILWVASLAATDPTKLDDLGLVSILPIFLWASLALVLCGFVLSLGARPQDGRLTALHLAILVIVLHGTPAITYETLRYSWAWKHLGVIDYIQRHGQIDHTAPFLAVYHNWPGFFWASAKVGNLFGLGPLEMSQVARFSSPVLNLLYLGVLPFIFRRFATDFRLIWSSVLFFLVGNWVGQDYFSPQGTAYLLYLVAIALCLGPLTPAPATPPGGEGLPWVERFRAFASAGQPERPMPTRPAVVAGVAVLFFVCVFAIAASHPLTPVVLFSALAGLAIVSRLSVLYAIVVLLVTALWALYFAAPFVASNLASEWATFGQPVAHAAGSLIDPGNISPGQVWVVYIGRALTAAVAIMAIIGGLRRQIAGYRDGTAIVLALAPLPVMMATSYGGEAAFRIYLFSLPFLAFFAAAAFFPTPAAGRAVASRTLFTMAALLMAVGFLFGNNGKDRQYRFMPDEIAAAAWLYASAPPGSLLVEGARNYPSQFMNYENFTYLPISRETRESRLEIQRNPVATLARWLEDPRWSAGYVIFTRSQKAHIEAQGIMPLGALDKIENALLASPRFRLIHATANARIFALTRKQGTYMAWPPSEN